MIDTYQYVKVSRSDDVLVLEFQLADLNDEAVVPHVGREMFEVAARPDCERLVVSFAGVRMLSSSALGKLILLCRRMHRKGGQLVFCDIGPAVEHIFKQSRLWEYFPINGPRDEALGMIA